MPKLEAHGDQTLKFKRRDTNMDWNYPFDFCGSIYRTSDVVAVYEMIYKIDKSKILKPNHFEFTGNQVLEKHL